jgi:general secretion pathway protein D
MIKVIPVKDARNSAIPVVSNDGHYEEDEYVTDYHQLIKPCARSLLPVLRPMIPQHSHLASSSDRSLIITDTYGNIKRIKEVIEKVESSMDKVEECLQISN